MLPTFEANPMCPQAHRVDSVLRETKDTFTLTLSPCNGAGSVPYAAGQFSMIYEFGVGEVPISMSGDPQHAGTLVYTVRSVGLATRSVIRRRPGECLGIRGPFGSAWPLAEACGKDVLLVAGGIGLAPLRPAIYQILSHRKDYSRLMVLYGARSPRDLLFRKELSLWARSPDTQLLTTVDYGDASWRGSVGVVTNLFRSLRLDPDRTVAMMCGPEIMMRFTIAELSRRRVSSANIYLSMERNMKCAVGFCGHCQYGPHFICKDGPVFSYDRVRDWLGKHEL
jgi:NAD(P)H-flavin reductase